MQDTYTAHWRFSPKVFQLNLVCPDLKEVPVRLRAYPNMSTGFLHRDLSGACF